MKFFFLGFNRISVCKQWMGTGGKGLGIERKENKQIIRRIQYFMPRVSLKNERKGRNWKSFTIKLFKKLIFFLFEFNFKFGSVFWSLPEERGKGCET